MDYVDARDSFGPAFDSVPAYLGVALALYLASGLAVLLLLARLSGRLPGRSPARRAPLGGALRLFAGYLAGLLSALALGLAFGDLVLGFFFSDVPPLGVPGTVWLLLSGAVAACLGLLSGLIAGTFELPVAALSVWVGAAVALEARFATEYGAYLFDPQVFLVAVPFAVFALFGGLAARLLRGRRQEGGALS